MNNEIFQTMAHQSETEIATSEAGYMRELLRKPVFDGFEAGFRVSDYIARTFSAWEAVHPELHTPLEQFRSEMEEHTATLYKTIKPTLLGFPRKAPPFIQPLLERGLSALDIVRIATGNELNLTAERLINAKTEVAEPLRTRRVDDTPISYVDSWFASGSADAMRRVNSINNVPIITTNGRDEEIADFVVNNLELMNQPPSPRLTSAMVFANGIPELVGIFYPEMRSIVLGTMPSSTFLFIRDKVGALEVSLHEISHSQQFQSGLTVPTVIQELKAFYDTWQAFADLGDFAWEKNGPRLGEYEAHYASWEAARMKRQYLGLVNGLSSGMSSALLADHNIRAYKEFTTTV